MMNLAERLHMTLGELAQRMTVDEFNLWLALDRIRTVERQNRQEGRGARA